MIITVSGTVDNVGITTLSLELARTITKHITPKSGTLQASFVLLVEADPAGGVLYDYMPDTTPQHKASLQHLLQTPAENLDQWLDNYTWRESGHKGLLRCLFSDVRSEVTAHSLQLDERTLVQYLKKHEDIISVVDVGRVLSPRPLVENADAQVWVLTEEHPACLIRARDMMGGVTLKEEIRVGVLSGELKSMPGKISEATGLSLLPDPLMPDPEIGLIGRKPSKQYREAVGRLTDYLLNPAGSKPKENNGAGGKAKRKNNA